MQWLKNLTAVAWAAAEVWVLSPAWCSGLKDPGLLWLWCRSQLFFVFPSLVQALSSLVQALSYVMGVAIKLKK